MSDLKNTDFITDYQDLLAFTKQLTQKYDPSVSSEADPGVVLIKLLALMRDKMSYKQDLAESQAYLDTVSDRQYAFDILQMLGYVLKENKSAKGYVEVRYNGVIPSSDFPVLPRFTVFSNIDNTVSYFSLEDVEYDDNIKNILVLEGSLFTIEKEGYDVFSVKDIDESGRFFLNKSGLAQNGVFIGIGSDPDTADYTKWTNLEVSTIYPNGQYFFVLTDTNGEDYIKFPQNFVDLIGDQNFVVKATYSLGTGGNCKAGTIVKIYENNYNVRQLRDITSGQDAESIQLGIQNYYESMEIFNTLVTSYDLQGTIKSLIDLKSNSSEKNKRYFSNGYTRTAIDRQIEIVARENDEQYMYYKFDDTKPDRQVDLVGLKDSLDYNESFKVVEEKPEIESDINSQLNSAKSLCTNVKMFSGTLDESEEIIDAAYYLAKTNLVGTVFADATDQAELDKILDNILLKLKAVYCASNLKFGKKIEYSELVQNILNADSKIVNVSLNSPEYQVYSMSYGSDGKVLSEMKHRAAAMSVINGNIPLYKFLNRSNQVTYSGLNAGYINAGFGMENWHDFGNDNLTAKLEDNGWEVCFNSNNIEYTNELLPYQLLQFRKIIKVAEVQYGYGVQYHYYSSTSSEIEVTTNTVLQRSSLIKSGSVILLDGDTDPSTGIINQFRNAFDNETVPGYWYCSNLPGDYSVTNQIELLTDGNNYSSIIAAGSIISKDSIVNGSINEIPHIPANVEYQLKSGELLYVWTTTGTQNTYSSGDYVKSSIDIYSSQSQTRPKETDNILGVNDYIESLKDDKNSISGDAYYFTILNGKNTIDLSNDNPYMLDDGEFFVYANKSLSEYIVLGSGTILSSVESLTLDNNKPDVTDINNVELSNFKQLRKEIQVTYTEISTFSEGCKIKKVDNLTDSSLAGVFDFKQLGSNNFLNKITVNDGTQEIIFGSDYSVRLCILLQSDENGLFCIYPKDSEGVRMNVPTGVVIELVDGYKISSGSWSANEVNSLLCTSIFSRLLTSSKQVDIADIVNNTVNYAVTDISTSGLSGKLENLTPKSVEIPLQGENVTLNIPIVSSESFFLFRVRLTEQAENSVTITCNNGTLTDLSNPSESQIRVSSQNKCIKLVPTINEGEEGGLVSITFDIGSTGGKIILTDLAIVEGYSDEIKYVMQENGEKISETANDYYNPDAGDIEEKIDDIIGESDRPRFDWLFTPTRLFEHPTKSESYFNSAHPYNYKTLPYIDFEETKKSLKILPIAKRF